MRKFSEKSRVASFDEIAIRMSGHDNVAVAKMIYERYRNTIKRHKDTG